VVSYDRIQTVIDTRTLFQRRWNLATVTIDTAGSLSLTGGDAAAVDVDDAVADELRAELDERLRAALAARRAGSGRRDRAFAAVDGDDPAGSPPRAGDLATVDGVATDEATARREEPSTDRRRGRRPAEVDGEADDVVWGGRRSGPTTGDGTTRTTDTGGEGSRVDADDTSDGDDGSDADDGDAGDTSDGDGEDDGGDADDGDSGGGEDDEAAADPDGPRDREREAEDAGTDDSSDADRDGGPSRGE
jgi:putative membrane protein